MAGEPTQGTTPQRGQWKSRFGFVLAAAGSAVGLGNIWKFPYITGENGGGWFVLIYLVCIVFIGAPVMIAEIMIGRAAQKSPVSAYESLSNGSLAWGLVGWMGAVTGFILLSYYSVVAGWTIDYVTIAFRDGFSDQDPKVIGDMFGALFGDFSRNVTWHAVFMVLTVGIVLGGVQRGIETGARILMPALFLMMIGLMVYSFNSPGFGEAADFVFGSHTDKLTPGGVLEALGHSFFTLSLGMGALITYGSYLKRDDDIVAAAGSITVLDTAVALMACLIMFPVIFSVGLPAKAGPGLVFVSMPTAFSQMPGGTVLGIVFFVLVFFAALTSSISLLEVAAATIIDKFGVSRTAATLGFGLAIFLFGLPSAKNDFTFIAGKNFFDSMDWAVSNVFLPVGGLLIAIFVGWVMPATQTREQFLTGTKLGGLFGIWLFLIRYIVPVAIGLVFFHAIGLI